MNFTDYEANVHNDPEQLKRIKSASAAKLTPLSIDSEKQTGLFQGSTTKYDVSLDYCPCADFRRRKLPCKHIYRLAMELGLFSYEFQSDISKSKSRVSSVSFSNLIDMIENLSEESQRMLLSDLRRIIYDKTPLCCHSVSDISELANNGIYMNCGIGEELFQSFSRNELNNMISKLNVSFKKNMSNSSLIEWCKENISDRYDELFSGYCLIRINNDYAKHNSNLYKYLHRKFDYENVWDGISSHETAIRLIDTVLPEDVVTENLIRKGFYKKK